MFLMLLLLAELTVRVEPERLYITEGASGVLKCRVVGDARRVTWSRSRGDIAPKNQVCDKVLLLAELFIAEF